MRRLSLRRTIAVAVVVSLLAGLVACGPDEGSPTERAEPTPVPVLPTPVPAAPTLPVEATALPPRPSAALLPPDVILVDNNAPGFFVESGEWGTCWNGDCGGTCYGDDFRFADPECNDCRARFDFGVPTTGEYTVWAWWPWGEDRATDTPFSISHSEGTYTVEVDQRNSGDDWFWLVALTFNAGEPYSIVVEGSDSGYANADAIALTPAGSGPPGSAGPPAAGAPVVQYFYSEESSAGCYYLHWDVSDAVTVYLDDAEVDNPGSTEVCPEETTIYTLWAENAADSVEQYTTIVVGEEALPTIPPEQPTPQPPPPTTGALVIDHTCTDISQIPEYWLEQAMLLTLHYAHTSHGSQIITGIEWLEQQDSRYSVAVRYCGDDAGLPAEAGALRICDGNPPGGDYIEPDDYWHTTDGLNRTRAVANSGLFNFSMWSWCGQQSENDVSTVQQYLDALDQLEQEYPYMRFIYMTGHTDGGGDILARNNDLVRQYVLEHDKVLFDFADIESYDPAGNYYPYTDDSCPWCYDWCDAHPQDCANLDQIDDCAHTHPLLCKIRAHAFWWMMARLAGWDGVPE